MPLQAGARLGPYEIVSPLGAGGMGEVYRGRDTRLDRTVAIKVVSSARADDPQWRDRLEREARAISALNHPHICTLHDVGHQDGVDFLVMECLDGETLADRLHRDRLPLAETVRLAIQIADALADAHRHGLIHRDIKPANVFVTSRGDAKILDFGLARVAARDEAATGVPTTVELLTLTADGAAVGTVEYMSPEQLRALPLDPRTDLFSFGALLYEMVTRERPFTGSSAIAVADAILHVEPRDIADPSVPGRLKALVRKLLAKDAAARCGSADEAKRELKAIEGSLGSRARSTSVRVATIAAVAAIVIALAAAGWFWRRVARERWALQTAAPEIARLIDADEFVKAAALTREARAVLPNDPTLEKLWNRATTDVSIATTPAGAEVSIRPYRSDPKAWQTLGKTPLKNVRVPTNDYVWRIEKAAFASTISVVSTAAIGNVKLWPASTIPPDMVPVTAGGVSLAWPFGLAEQTRVDDFLIDRHEVTNDEYKKFVDAGGYERREFWTEPFVKNGRTIPWDEAIATFRDATGRPGPATWEVGTIPKGLENHPVAGVSWYEAAAYARFAGKTLPTVYHWRRAAQTNQGRLIVPASNFSRATTVPVGSAPSGFGTTDMAGNVKEWCLNEGTAGRRFILGGGFGEASYMFDFMDTASQWERRPTYGFRGVRLDSPPAPVASAKLELAVRDMLKDPIVSDDVFAAFKGLYAYDHADLHPIVEETRSLTDATLERVTFDAAYGNERVIARLFLPKKVAPPYQVVVYFPSAGAVTQDRFEVSNWFDGYLDVFVKTGRALLVPTYKSTFERRDSLKPGGPPGNPPALWRDHMIMWSKDLGRSLDYLETRTDIDRASIAYYGFSFGGGVAPVLLAMEPRIKAAALSSGGLWFQRALPEADGTNFVTRVTTPLLMLNGRYDSLFPVESSQFAIFKRLGTPEKDKKHVIYEGGHGTLPHAEEVRETLDWLDKYLGPVRK